MVTSTQQADNTVTQTQIYTKTVTGGTLGATSCAETHLKGHFRNDGGNSLTLQLNWGGTSMFTPSSNPSVGTANVWWAEITICNQAATNSQRVFMRAGQGGTINWHGQTTAIKDTTSDQAIELLATWNAASPESEIYRYNGYTERVQ
jgi:hypothetical protein